MSDLAYRNYWRRKELVAQAPRFGRCRYWPVDERAKPPALSERDAIIYQAVSGAPDLLDVGAGDLFVKRLLENAGYQGVYDTQDVSAEFAYTYRDLAEVKHPYHAILFIGVLEHLPLAAGMEMLDRLITLLAPGGVLIVQTPNALCCRNQWGTDMTHLHCYNLTDLWAHLSTYGLSVEGYRVVYTPRRWGLWTYLRFLAQQIVASQILGSDYADGILLVARKGTD